MIELVGRRRRAPQVDLTSLIDVVFILVIFVVLAASFQRMRVLDVTLPEARTGAAVEAPEVVEVAVGADGRLRVDGVAVALDGLEAHLNEVRGARRQVVLQLDAAAPSGRAVRVLGEVRAAGFDSVSIAAEPVRGGAGAAP